MPYLTTTFAAAKTDLASHLNDPNKIHWSDAEIGRYIKEALRMWSAATACYRDQGIVHATPGRAFYDAALDMVQPLCTRTVTDAEALSWIEYMLLEVQGTTWAGSSQFTLDQILGHLQRRRDQFLRETGVVLTRQTSTIAPPPDGRIHLSQNWLDMRRVAWKDVDGRISPLRRDDEWGIVAYRQKWVQQPTGPPLVYSVGVTPPLVLQLAPGPVDTGQLDLVGVQRGTSLNPALPVLLGVPDDWAWVVVFGTMADLLSLDGLAQDLPRAKYCDQRWSNGITMATVAPTILAARVGNKPLQLRSLSDADVYKRGWQSQQPWEPDAVLMAGGTFFAVTPTPDANVVGGQYDVTLDVVRKAPLPVNDTDFLQAPEDTLNTILDYAQHLAMFKDGYGSLSDSFGLAQDFFGVAGIGLELQQANMPTRGPLQQGSVQDQRTVPRRAQPEPATVASVEDR